MLEIVVPDTFDAHPGLDAPRLSLSRTMVGRHVYAFDGPLDDGLALARTLSEDAASPVLVNHVIDETDDTRIVDVYMHQDGQHMSTSERVEKPLPEAAP